MSNLTKNLYSGFIFKPDNLVFHPLVNIMSLSILFVLSVLVSGWYLLLLLMFVLIEILLIHMLKDSLLLIKSIVPLLILILFLTTLFGGLPRGMSLVLRLVIGTLVFSIFFTTTNPYELSKLLEKLKIPQKYAYIPALSMSLLPRTFKDANDTFETLMFRGELSSSYFSYIPKTLALIIASALYRSEFIAQSLYIRHFGNENRKVYIKHKFHIDDLTKSIYYILIAWIYFLWLN